ncbi:LytR C-terminal domain-containing protein [Nocardioides yefusunii]|uniref:LytR C-terminal domain-containing protein n=1 Tax=Nocardioides yefusunii TaxID=2500546 RepID=A0ABW1QZ09_9ACTN|nr:LytR C-terminal domain-containing protein [Nocardioides yefusunii]
MTPRSRSALTLTALAGLVLGGGAIGWTALTAPLPEQEEIPVCVKTKVEANEEIFADQVTVSVYNGSSKAGLASRTLADLVERGFVRGEGGNAPKKIKRGVQIWAANPANPGVQLVAGQFRNAKIVEGPKKGTEDLGPGVIVVIGNEASLRTANKAPDSFVATSPGTICTPPGHASLVDSPTSAS